MALNWLWCATPPGSTWDIQLKTLIATLFHWEECLCRWGTRKDARIINTQLSVQFVWLPLWIIWDSQTKYCTRFSFFNLVERRNGPSKARCMIHERARGSLINEMPAIHVEDAQQVSDKFLTSIPSFPFIKEWDISQQDYQPQPGPITPEWRFCLPRSATTIGLQSIHTQYSEFGFSTWERSTLKIRKSLRRLGFFHWRWPTTPARKTGGHNPCMSENCMFLPSLDLNCGPWSYNIDALKKKLPERSAQDIEQIQQNIMYLYNIQTNNKNIYNDISCLYNSA